MEQTDASRHVTELVDRAHMCMLTTMTTDGKHVSRPMALQDVEFDGDLWFFTYEDSNKVTEIKANPEVNVSFSNDKQSEWTSISGRGETVHDRVKVDELWSPALQAWFPDGKDTPGLTLVRVGAETAEYWESSSSKVVRLIGAARAAVSGDPDKFPSDNATVEL